MKGILTPRGMAIAAATIALAYWAVHLAGWRDATTILSGTAPTGNATLHALTYLALHFAFVLAAPILTIAAILMLATLRLRSRLRSASASASASVPKR